MHGYEGGSTGVDNEWAQWGLENVGAWILGREPDLHLAASDQTYRCADRRFSAARRPQTSGLGETESDASLEFAHKPAYFSYPMYRDLRDRCSAFDGLIAFASAQIGFTWNNRSELVPAEMVSGNYFSVLDVRSALGRVLLPSDDTKKDGNPAARGCRAALFNAGLDLS